MWSAEAAAGPTAAGPTAAEWDEARLLDELHDVHARLDDTDASPRTMTAEPRRRGFCVNHEWTERLMDEHAIVAADGRRRKERTTIPDVAAPPPPDD